MQNYVVSKFGGSSLANDLQVDKSTRIVLSEPCRKYIVVSAPGKVPNGHSTIEQTKLTDVLISLAIDDGKYSISDVERKFSDTGLDCYGDVHARNMAELEDGLSDFSMPDEQRLDFIKSRGEDFMARLMAEHFNENGMDAQYISPKNLMIVSSEYGDAQVLDGSYARLAALKNLDKVIVFPGFFGFNKEGHETTFSRGGSDLTGSVLAVGVDAVKYENWTDTDGIFSADPRIVENPVGISEITHTELRELTYMGFNVFHDEAMIPAMRGGIEIDVVNTNNPFGNGTKIVSERDLNEKDLKYALVGVAHKGGFCMLNIEKIGMNREHGFGRRVLQTIEEGGLSYEHMLSSIDVLSVVLDNSQFEVGTLNNIIEQISDETGADNVYVAEEDIALLNVVGRDLKCQMGVASRVAQALAEENINILLMDHGANKDSMIYGIENRFGNDAVRAVYQEFFAVN